MTYGVILFSLFSAMYDTTSFLVSNTTNVSKPLPSQLNMCSF